MENGYYLLFQRNKVIAQLVEGPQFILLPVWLESLSSFHCALLPRAFTGFFLSWGLGELCAHQYLGSQPWPAGDNCVMLSPQSLDFSPSSSSPSSRSSEF